MLSTHLHDRLRESIYGRFLLHHGRADMPRSSAARERFVPIGS